MTGALPNALLNSQEIWSLLLWAYPLSVLTHPFLHPYWKAKSRRTEPHFDECKSSLKLIGEAIMICGKPRNPTAWGSHPGGDPRVCPVPISNRGTVFDEDEHLKLISFQKQDIRPTLFYNPWRMLPNCHPTPKKAEQCFPSICRTSNGVQGTIYLSKLTGITLSRTGASRKVHGPQLQRHMRTGREFSLFYGYYFRSTWRINLINAFKLELPSLKGLL